MIQKLLERILIFSSKFLLDQILSDDYLMFSFLIHKIIKTSERKQTRVKKSKRKKADKDACQYYSNINGKRKRSTTLTQNEPATGSQMSSYTVNKLKKNEFNELGLPMQCDFDSKTNKFIHQNENKMELDDDLEESTSISEESNLSDRGFLEADDEQSDYYEVSNFQKKNNNQRQKYGRNLDKTPNPFSMFSSTSPSTSSVLWKRRRNLPSNHFN